MATQYGQIRDQTGYKSDLFQAYVAGDGLGADVLLPGNSTSTEIQDESGQNKTTKKLLANAGTQIIDVHAEYPWTLSPVAARATTPAIEITEYKQVLSSELLGYAYSLAGTVDNFRVAAANLPVATRATAGLVKSATNTLQNVPGLGFASKLVGGVAQLVGNATKEGYEEALNKQFSEVQKGAAEVDKSDVTKNDPNNGFLAPYRGLYAVEPTGFIYRLPYKSESNFSQSNSWGDPEKYAGKALGSVLQTFFGGGGGAGADGGAAGGEEGAGGPGIGQVAGSIMDIAKGVMTATGGVIKAEKPKSYQGPQSTESITVKFILYNTINFKDIKRNWELCYLLSYQNLPNRKGINLMDPPKLYRLLIPGYRQFPMCWVTSLDIKNLGAVRMLDITDENSIINTRISPLAAGAASSYSPSVKLVPEAYEITITFESAFYSSQNLFAYSLNPSSVVTTTITVSEVLDSQLRAGQPAPNTTTQPNNPGPSS